MFKQMIKDQKHMHDPRYPICMRFAKRFLNLNEIQANAVAKGMLEHKEWLEDEENANII